jgi:MoaA/NifB/PqqE/SkfB family radical SAM enzyme
VLDNLNKSYIESIRQCDIAHLQQLKSSLNAMWENEVFPTSFEMPITVQYELMTECSLKCLHCYNRSGDDDLVTKMKLQNWIDLSKHLVDSGGIFQCILSGGEPLLMGKKRLPQIMDILHNDGTSFVMITNALNFDNEWMDILKKYRFYWIQVSIDGSEEKYHDYFRGVEGSWRKCIETCLTISKHGFPLVVSHTVTPSNIHKMDEMVSLAYQLGASSIILGESLPSGRANKNENEIALCTPKLRNLYYQNLENLAAEYRGKLEVQRSSGTMFQLRRYQILPNMGCIVRPNGDVRMDCMAPFTIGNVLEKPFKEIWMEKGRTCWQDPRVDSYISNIDDFSHKNPDFLNHVQKDVVL